MASTDIVSVTEEDLSLFDRFRDLDVESYPFNKCKTYIDPIGPIYEKDAFAALVHANGNMSKAAGLLNRSRDALRRWLKHRPDFIEMVTSMEDSMLDSVEEVLHSQALSGDPAQVRFVMSTKGKNRGYSTRVENTGKDGAELDFGRIASARITEERAQQIAEELLSRMANAKVIDAQPAE